MSSTQSQAGGFFIRAEETAGIVRLYLSGELDMATVPELERSLMAAEAVGPETIVLDAADLSFIDSTGLRGVLAAHHRASERERTLVLSRTSSAVRNVLALTGTLELVDESARPEVGEALSSVSDDAWRQLPIPDARDAT